MVWFKVFRDIGFKYVGVVVVVHTLIMGTFPISLSIIIVSPLDANKPKSQL